MAALAVLLLWTFWGSQGAQAGRATRSDVRTERVAFSRLFKGPTYIAVDSHGVAYLADTAGSRVDEISPAGRLVNAWTRQAGSTRLITPVGIALNGHGDVYVADASRREIDTFSPAGRLLARWNLRAGRTQVRGPGGIATGPGGVVYVVDQVADQVIKLSPHGKLLARWGGRGSARGRYLNPHGVATDRHGNVYVADYSDLRVVKLSSTGRVLAIIGAGRFDEDEAPQSVAIGPGGDIYVGAGGVMIFSPSGKLLARRTTYGAHQISLAGAFGVAVDHQGSVYVVDQPGRALVKLSPRGITLAVWK